MRPGALRTGYGLVTLARLPGGMGHLDISGTNDEIRAKLVELLVSEAGLEHWRVAIQASGCGKPAWQVLLKFAYEAGALGGETILDCAGY